MPELPEMETYKRLLQERIGGKKVTHIVVNREKSLNVPIEQFIGEVMGGKVVQIERRGKHLLFYLQSDKVLLLHLMLGGWMHYGTAEDQPQRTKQIELHFEDGKTLYFIGLRLGYLHLLDRHSLQERLGDLGPELFDEELSEPYFIERLKQKKGQLKPLLVNQHWLAGIGNCYADEICFDAGILPFKRVDELGTIQCSQLYSSMKKVLQEAIEYGGYMEHPLFVGDRLTGGYNEMCRVYDRGGDPCVRCGQLIVQEELSSRKVFYCRHCQS